MSRKGRVVVGVDGSECSLEALRWAFEEASRHGAELVAVTTWTLAPPPIVYPYAGFSRTWKEMPRAWHAARSRTPWRLCSNQGRMFQSRSSPSTGIQFRCLLRRHKMRTC
jgi:hypothetical protein